MINITIQSVADADYFKIKKYPAEFFDAKPKAYELSRGGLNEDTAEIPVTAKNVHNGSALFTNVAVADIEVNGETYETYEELSAVLTPILFSKGGGSGDGGTGIQSIQEGDNISIDNTDPLNPIVSATISNSYSTQEILTGGTWIDEKPIYRKVFVGLSNVRVTNLYPEQLDKIVSLQSICVSEDNTSTYHGYQTDIISYSPLKTTNVGAIWNKLDEGIDVISSLSEENEIATFYQPINYAVIVEYTKTTSE